MPTPHHGTPEELQELRSRIEALELRQRIHSVILSTAEQAEQGVVTRAEFEAAIARIATAPATSEQGRRPLSTRLAHAACPMPSRCPAPCEMCASVAERVVGEYINSGVSR